MMMRTRNLFLTLAAVLLIAQGCGMDNRKNALPEVNTLAALSGGACDPAGPFERALHTELVQSCASCHGTTQNPLFATLNPQQSWINAEQYINLSNAERSLILTKATDGHCGEDTCASGGASIGAGLENMIAEYQAACKAAGGENDPNLRYSSKAIVMPTGIPNSGNNFKQIAIPLSEFLGMHDQLALDGSLFLIDVQIYSETYRFRNPRIASSSRALQVRGLTLYVNGESYRTYDNIEAQIGIEPIESAPTLSSQNALALLNQGEGVDTFSVQFDDIRIMSDGMSCTDLNYFVQNIKPDVVARNCFGCHSGNGNNGSIPARVRFSMAGTDEDLCRKFKQRTNGIDPYRSPIIQFPAGQANGHTLQMRDGTWSPTAWLEWIEREHR